MTTPVVPDQLNAARYASVTAVDRSLAGQAAQAWSVLDAHDLQGSFVNGVLPVLHPAVMQAQTVAADMGGQAMGAQLQAAGVEHVPAARPSAFAGYASDGRPLTSLLAQPLIETYRNINGGMPADEALTRGGDSMDRILTTQVHDAARQAGQAVLVGTHSVTYYVRVCEPGACGRCLILAGVHYKWNKGFERHPQCRCHHAPHIVTYDDATDQIVGQDTPTPFAAAPVKFPTDREIFDNMSRQEQDRTFTIGGAQAIRDGADIPRVVNSRRLGVSTASDQYGAKFHTTSAGAKRGEQRLLPEACYQLAGGNRDEAIRLLRRNGYITESPEAAKARIAAKAKADAAKARTEAQAAKAAAKAEADAAKVQARVEAAKAKAARAEAEKAAQAELRALSDDDIAERLEVAYTSEDDATANMLEKELDRRDAAAQAAERNRARVQAYRDAKKEAQHERISQLIEQGEDPYDAVFEVTGVTPVHQKQLEVLADLKRNGYSQVFVKGKYRPVRGFDEAVRMRFNDLVAEDMVKAEDYTVGGDMRNRAGIRAKVTEDSLFYGTEEHARKYASTELRQFWDDHGRLTLESLKDLLINGRDGSEPTRDFLT